MDKTSRDRMGGGRRRPRDDEPPPVTPPIDVGDARKGVRCPKCQSTDHYVYSTEPVSGERRKRYRVCRSCLERFSTVEHL